MIEAPPPLVAAFAAGLASTMGAHMAIVRTLRPPGEWHLDKPIVGLALYGAGAVLCGLITYTAWCELYPPASVAISAAWGLAHPMATAAAMWGLKRKAPSLARRVVDEHERGEPRR